MDLSVIWWSHSPSLEVFKEQLRVALSAVVCWHGGVQSGIEDLGDLFQ